VTDLTARPALLAADEIEPAAELWRRFAGACAGRLPARPEVAPTPAELVAVVAEAEELGLLDCGPDGLGLWSRPHDPGAVGLTLEALAALGRVRAAAAWHLHQLALGRLLCRELGLDGAHHPLAILHTGHPLAHRGLAAVLAGPARDEAGYDEVLPPVGAEGAWLVQVTEPWDALLVPRGGGEAGAVAWQLLPRAALQLDDLGPGHGLDGLVLAQACVTGGVAPARSPTAAPGVETLALALGVTVLARVAVSVGALRRALTVALDYARTRRQGGARIIEYPAVQQLLGEALGVAATAEAALRGAVAPQSRHDLATLVGLAATLLPRLCDAGNAALQSMGGIGYMRDAGVEGAVRDLNHLRVLGGAPEGLRVLALRLHEAS